MHGCADARMGGRMDRWEGRLMDGLVDGWKC
jgi:hypothetical protein